MAEKIPVLVTGVGGGGNGEQILKALRLADDMDLMLIGTDMSPVSAGQRLVDRFYQVPSAKDPSYKQCLFDILKQNAVRFIFHGSEPELAFISENREEFRHAGIVTCLNSQALMRLCMNKVETYQALERLDFSLPSYRKIDRVEDLAGVGFFPVVLKPNTSSGGSSHVYIARDPEELDLLGRYMLKVGLDIVAQEYVGTYEDEYTIGVNSGEHGEILGSIVVKRIIGNAISTRMRIPARNGGTPLIISSGFSQGKICHMPELQAQAEDLAKQLGSVGPLNIQCRFVNGQLMLMEINPRLSGTASLRAMVGYNEPAMHIRHVLYGTPWTPDYEEKTILRTLEEVVIREATACTAG